MFQIRFQGAERLRLRSATWLYGIWIVLAIAGSAVAWWLVQAGIERDRLNSEQDARRAVRAYATAYEQYLSRSLSQVEQVAAQLRHAWEQAGGDFDLQGFRSEGLLVGSAVTEAAILDRHGRVVAAVPGRTRASVGPDDRALAHHRSNNSSAALISGLPGDAAPRQRRLRMTLRLETRDSDFAGMVALVVDADFLTRDFNMGVLGRHGLVAAMLDGGEVRLEGHESAIDGSLFSMAPALAADEGETQLDGTHFSDGIARLVAWRRSTVYPMVALAAERTDDIYAAVSGEADAMWRRWFLASCAGATIALLLVAITHHMLRRRAGEEEIRSAYRAATENAKEGFYMAKAVRDAGGRVIDFVIADCNGRGAAIYSATPEELIGRRLSEIEGDANGGSIEPYLSAMRNGIYEDERQMPNGRRMKITWGKRRVVRVGDGLAFTLQDISERKAFESELSWLANHDALTGLPSRAWVTRFVPRAIVEAAGKGQALAVLLIDLDDFRHVNDTHGHAVGDELLKQAALRLGAAVRPQDVVGRFGGDEFVVLLDKGGTDAELAATAGRLACAMSRTYEIGAAYHTIGASIGISRYPRDGADAPTLIRHADIAMSAAKRDRHDHVRLFDVALFREVTERASLRRNLQQALPRGQFSLHYQPRVDLATGRMCSMEALLRWHHPDLGMVPPATFIPVAEECGLIAAIGEFVVEQACRQLALWRAAGVAAVPLSINVSAHQLEEGGVHAHLALHLARHHLPVAMVEVEVTESAMVGEGGRVQAELSALRALGVRLHVDDFGTGYSSLAQLQRLEMDVLKIDRAFTAELTRSGEGHALVQAIVSMAKALGMGVVAEGVETPCQLAALQALGCDEAQGYLFAAPLPPAGAEALLRRGDVMPGFANPSKLSIKKL